MDDRASNRYRSSYNPFLLGVTRPSPSQERKQWSATRSLEALIISQSNPKVGNKYIRGGPFFVHKRYEAVEPSEMVTQEITSGLYKGLVNHETRMVPSVLCPWSRDTPPTAAQWSLPAWSPYKASMEAWGATGFARARPGQSMADTAVAGLELAKDGLPSIPGILAGRAKNLASLGGEFLNLAFGWLPLLRDVDKMLLTAQAMEKYLDQLIRDNGRLVRRRRQLSSTKDTSSKVTNFTRMGAFYPSMTSTFGGVPGSFSSILEEKWTIRTRWFVGAFRYHIPGYGGRDTKWIDTMRRRIWGADITPQILWQIVPWSWFADYFANYGDVLANVSRNAVGHPVAEYAFVMEQVETGTRITARGWLPAGSSGGAENKPYNLTASYTSTVIEKGRVAASPYGFGITYDGLSDYQKAVLTALGISRARF